MIAANFEVMLSSSKRGETSAMSNDKTLSDFTICLIKLSTISGCKPKGCGALTPGAKADEKTSAQIVKYNFWCNEI